MTLMKYGYLPLNVEIYEGGEKRVLNSTDINIVDDVLLVHAGK